MFTSYIEQSNKHDKEYNDVKTNIIRLESNDKIIEDRLQHIIDIITADKMDKTNGK
jgi:predicted patatin/cPLA2 family phospholipase